MPKLVFTSCMDAERAPLQPVWDRIRAREPDLLMLLGDQIYMDWGLSLAQEPAAKRAILKNPEQALPRFAEDMHARYAAQWGVENFRELMRWFSANRPPENLLVTWDEHDMAWNNAYGEGADPHAVPAVVKTVSKALFEQFVAVLRNPASPNDYPPIPDKLMDLPTATRGVQPAAPLDIGRGIRIVLLDERFYRTQRDEAEAHLLGSEQQHALFAALGHKPLTIVAGSSPLVHDYLLGHQGWAAPAKKSGGPVRNYPDYEQFLTVARNSGKAVLYLAGDIHSNHWTGRIDGSPVVQALSSGAALGNIALKRHPPCYGVVDIDEAASTVRLKLMRLDLADGGETVDRNETLRHDAHSWIDYGSAGQGTPIRFDGEDAPLVRDMSALCLRQRADGYRERWDELVFDRAQFQTLHDASSPRIYDNYPEVLRFDADPARFLRARRSGNDPSFSEALVREAFQRAQAAGRPAVLFVHGFGKDLSAAIAQAQALATRYDVEVLPLCWPAGEGDKLFARIEAVTAARAYLRQPLVLEAARQGVAQFARVGQDFPGVPKVLLARSLGSELLWKALPESRGDLTSLLGCEPEQAFCRLFLSAPAVAVGDHRGRLDEWNLPTAITYNRDDYVLRAYDWLISGHPLGSDGPKTGRYASPAQYFDCTDCPGVSRDHDYLMRDGLSANLEKLNRLLIRGEPIPDPPPGFTRADAHRHDAIA